MKQRYLHIDMGEKAEDAWVVYVKPYAEGKGKIGESFKGTSIVGE